MPAAVLGGWCAISVTLDSEGRILHLGPPRACRSASATDQDRSDPGDRRGFRRREI